MYLRRGRVAGRSFAAALTYVSTVVTPPEPAAQNLGVGLRRSCRGQACGGVLVVVNFESHTHWGTFLGSFVCGAN
jgi:hypothetical protein